MAQQYRMARKFVRTTSCTRMCLKIKPVNHPHPIRLKKEGQLAKGAKLCSAFSTSQTIVGIEPLLGTLHTELIKGVDLGTPLILLDSQPRRATGIHKENIRLITNRLTKACMCGSYAGTWKVRHLGRRN